MLRTAIFNDGENFRHTICDLFAKPQTAKGALGRHLFDPGHHLFDWHDYLPKQANWAGFFHHLVGESRIEGTESRLVRAYWYVVGDIDSWPKLPPRKVWESGKRNYNYVPKQLDEWHQKNTKGIRELVKYMTDRHSSKKFSAERENVEEILDELRWRKNSREQQFKGQLTLQRAIVRKHRQIEFRRSGGIRYDLFTKKHGQEKTTDVNLAVDMVTLKDTYDIAVIVSGDQDFVPAAGAVKNLGKTVVNIAFRAKNGQLLPGGAQRLNEAVDWCVEVDYDTFRGFMFPDCQPPSKPKR